MAVVERVGGGGDSFGNSVRYVTQDLRFRVRYVIALACTIAFGLIQKEGNFALYLRLSRLA